MVMTAMMMRPFDADDDSDDVWACCGDGGGDSGDGGGDSGDGVVDVSGHTDWADTCNLPPLNPRTRV